MRLLDKAIMGIQGLPRHEQLRVVHTLLLDIRAAKKRVEVANDEAELKALRAKEQAQQREHPL